MLASGLNITGGKVSGGGGAGNGGGIRVLSGASLNLSDSTVSNNDAEDDGGAIFLYRSTAYLRNTTISSNTGGRNGAGIDVAYNSSLTLLNSTVSGNTSSTANRSVISARGSTSRILMYNNTIANNTTNNGASLDVQGTSSVSVTDSIIAGTVNGVDCRAAGSSILTVNNTSIIQSGGCPGQAVDPMLGPLDDNGGPTQTHALLENSPAIDPAAGSNSVFTDQRGFRFVGGKRDIGAFEFGSTPGLNFTINSTSDTTAATNNSTECTLREAIASVNADRVLANGCVNDPTTVAGDSTVINFAPNIVGNTITLSQDELAINRDVSINPVNLSGNTTTIDANEQSRVFSVKNSDVSFNHLTITGGLEGTSYGGGIYVYRGDVNLNNSTVSGNSADLNGGGIFSVGAVSLNNSTVSGNSAIDSGGGIYARNSNVSLSNSTLSDNSAANIAGVYTPLRELSLSNSIIANSPGANCLANSVTSSTDSISDDGNCGDATRVDNALLGPLADNGGPTLTHALLPGSPAINIGNANCPITDQRGETRDANCDAGAFEFIEEEGSFFVIPMPDGGAAIINL